jgi:hypothetical protein
MHGVAPAVQFGARIAGGGVAKGPAKESRSPDATFSAGGRAGLRGKDPPRRCRFPISTIRPQSRRPGFIWAQPPVMQTAPIGGIYFGHARGWQPVVLLGWSPGDSAHPSRCQKTIGKFAAARVGQTPVVLLVSTARDADRPPGARCPPRPSQRTKVVPRPLYNLRSFRGSRSK